MWLDTWCAIRRKHAADPTIFDADGSRASFFNSYSDGNRPARPAYPTSPIADTHQAVHVNAYRNCHACSTHSRAGDANPH